MEGSSSERVKYYYVALLEFRFLLWSKVVFFRNIYNPVRSEPKHYITVKDSL